MNVEPAAQTQEQVPNVEELTAAFERVDGRIRALDLVVLEAEVARSERAATAASVEVTINPSQANLAAHAAAKLEEERAREQLGRRGAEVRALEEAKEKLRFAISQIRAAESGARIDKATAELKSLLAAKHDDLAKLVGAVLTLESLSGGRPWPHEVGQAIGRHGGLDLAALCNAAQGRANAARTGTKEA